MGRPARRSDAPSVRDRLLPVEATAELPTTNSGAHVVRLGPSLPLRMTHTTGGALRWVGRIHLRRRRKRLPSNFESGRRPRNVLKRGIRVYRWTGQGGDSGRDERTNYVISVIVNTRSNGNIARRSYHRVTIVDVGLTRSLLSSNHLMLIAAQHLVDRLRHPRSRADEVFAVRRRLVVQPAPSQVSEEERTLAHELRRLRDELTEALGLVRACAGCARGRSLPHGRWRGGHCCGGRTAEIFTDDELGALRLSGTTPARLAAPRSEHAGCAFRGPEGCSLDVADRPNLCVRYICRELEAELTQRADVAHVKRLAQELGRTFERFARLRASRVSS